MQEDKLKNGGNLPENAFRELKKGEEYVPVMKPGEEYPEVTPYSVSVGLLMAVIFKKKKKLFVWNLQTQACIPRLFASDSQEPGAPRDPRHPETPRER